VTATTVRLPEELHDELSVYCERTGAVMNRVMAIALRSFLDGPRLPEREREIVDDLRSHLDASEAQ
jgi:predicted transcriptional regulator